MCRRVAVLALLVLAMLSDRTWARKRQAKEIAELTSSDSYDMGVAIHVVRRKAGAPELLPGIPLEILRTHRRGGMASVWYENEKPRAELSGPSAFRTVWFVSEAGEEIVLHSDSLPKWQLVQGSEGSSKTVYIAQWLYLHGVLPYIGTDGEAGFTAPIEKRIAHIRREIAKHWPAGTYKYNAANKLYTFYAGPRVQLVSAHIRSEAEGSPLQGYSWTVAAGDELQDHHERDADIIARIRDPRGSGKRLNSSTFKDSSEWRNFKAAAEKNPNWHIRRLLGLESPFINPEHWERFRLGVTEREYRRRVLAEDVGPEKQLYYSWSRDNVRPVPVIGATDITTRELSPWTPNAGILIGHDPGKRYDVSIFLKAYRVAGVQEPVWWAVDEITTDNGNYQDHVHKVVERLRTRWNCNHLDRKGRPDPDSLKALVRADPYTENGSDEERPDLTFYKIWQKAGVDIRPAAFKPGTASRSNVPKEARIDVVNTLLLGGGQRRLFVACDSRGSLACPKLVEAFEGLERDGLNRAEKDKKGSDADLSHWPCALGYGIWAVEKPRLERLRGVA